MRVEFRLLNRKKILFLCVFLFLFVLISESFASDVKKRRDEMNEFDFADVSVKIEFPYQDVYETIMEMIKKGNSATSKDLIVAQQHVNVMLKGFHNSSYSNAVDLPLTRYVLGNATVDIKKFYDIYYAFLENDPLMKPFLEVVKSNPHFDRSSQINDFMKETQNSLALVMVAFPIVLLIIMYLAQYVIILWTYLTKPVMAERISLWSNFPRFVVFLLAILFYRRIVEWAITFSNYMSIAMIPLEVQEIIVKNIIEQVTGVFTEEGGGLMEWIASSMRSLGYVALKILFIARDVFLSVSVIMGGICIAFGFSTSYENKDPIHEYLTGWFEDFIKLLLWGPFAAIAVVGMGLITLIGATGVLSSTAIGVVSLSFLYAAANIPNLAEKMSGLMLQSLLVTAAPYVQSVLQKGIRGGMALGGIMLAPLAGALRSRIVNWGGGGDGGAQRRRRDRPAVQQVLHRRHGQRCVRGVAKVGRAALPGIQLK